MQYFPIKYVGCEHPNNNQTTYCIDKDIFSSFNELASIES